MLSKGATQLHALRILCFPACKAPEHCCGSAQSSLSMHAATVMGVLVNCRRVRGAVWAAGGASSLLPTLATASPQALRGEP